MQKLRLMGNRVVVKDNPTTEESNSSGLTVKTDIPQLITGIVKYTSPNVSLNEGDIVRYVKTVGSRFMMDGEEFRSITDPETSILFKVI